MIEKIEIRNFQSHQATNIELSPNVNSIQGNSDCGKSAVMRALNWLIFNPAGDYFVSDWAKKGKTISAPCEITLQIDGHRITRRRDKDFNGYVLDGEIFEATRNSVPPQVASILGLGEVNVQKQLDPPFLLSMSAGDVSRYINSLVNLTRIDKWTTAVNGRSRTLMQSVEAARQKETAARRAVERFNFLPKLEEVVLKATEIESRIKGSDSVLSQMLSSVADWENNAAVLGSIPDADKALSILNDAEKARLQAIELNNNVNELLCQISTYESTKKQLESVPDLDAVASILNAANSIDQKRTNIKNNLVAVSSAINSRLSVSVPNIDERFFEIVETLGRWSNIKRNLENAFNVLNQEIEKFDNSGLLAASASKDLNPLLEQLSTMTCPLCGRKGNCTHEEI